MICANILPRQHTRIPWGWKNATRNNGISGTETYVVEPKGDMEMPELCSYFDWDTYLVEGAPCAGLLGTRNFKSIFTTATRLLGFERLLMETPDLTPVFAQFHDWNQRLMDSWYKYLKIFFLGDDIAGNQGLFMSRRLFQQWLKPLYKKLFALTERSMIRIFHSDGDIYDILPDIMEIGADWVSYEPVGRMREVGTTFLNMRMVLVEDQRQTHANSMALQR